MTGTEKIKVVDVATFSYAFLRSMFFSFGTVTAYTTFLNKISEKLLTGKKS